jgi:hypothetical protein
MKGVSEKIDQLELSGNVENNCPVPASVLLVIGGKVNKGENEPENKKKPGDFERLQVLETRLLRLLQPQAEKLPKLSKNTKRCLLNWESTMLGIYTITSDRKH